MSQAHRILKTKKSYRVARPTQTGFSSPATHYNEPRIDLNDALVENPSATFFVRVSDERYAEFNINPNDVLIIDKSLKPKNNHLAMVIKDDDFKIIRIDEKTADEILIWGTVTYVINSVL